MSNKKVCKGCNKNLNKAMYQGDNEYCVFCDKDAVIPAIRKSKDYEEVEDVGCVGGGCTL